MSDDDVVAEGELRMDNIVVEGELRMFSCGTCGALVLRDGDAWQRHAAWHRAQEDRPAILRALAEAWERSPHERLCQLVVNVVGRADPFYVDDEELYSNLKKYGAGRR